MSDGPRTCHSTDDISVIKAGFQCAPTGIHTGNHLTLSGHLGTGFGLLLIMRLWIPLPLFSFNVEAHPLGRSQSSTAMPVGRRTTHLVLQVVLSPQHATRSEPNGSFARAITHDLALSVPHRMGSEESVSNIDRLGIGGGELMYTGV